MRLSTFERLPPTARARIDDGLSVAIDAVATRAVPTHGFLRYGWYAAALDAYGGRARTLVVEEEGRPALALPFVGIGPGFARAAAVPGSYWPFRSFPLAADAGEAVLRVALAALARAVTVLRIGPVYDDDSAVMPLIAAARAQGWAVLGRFVADSWLLDMTARQQEGPWPRGSTLRKNRFHEKHLASHGVPDWRFLSGADWPAAFDDLAAVEQASWIASRTDGSDAKFTREGHGAFWRAAAQDPVLAQMMRAALLTIDGKPAAFSFDLDAGALTYAIANSYDPAYAKHSPGKLLYYRNLVHALARGITRVDWGAGDSGYKQVIGADRGPAIRDWLLVRPGVPALVGRLAAGVWRRSGQ
ncbi:GNAT family N-acetyltransferase [Arthrobacter sp. TPD3018]|nr:MULTISPECIES: GNAT family N-acetyltransferase [Sphingomonas]PVE53392.1 GNAT family N-acetyltransferase [Sphingomonas sp. TPD3009]PVE56170.1 GNAT family N-acetyltransferase [Arthrobacter sp. TPD3018]PVE81769.1 GNAT family N-acetyltransferase [Sphingomonas melonis]